MLPIGGTRGLAAVITWIPPVIVDPGIDWMSRFRALTTPADSLYRERIGSSLLAESLGGLTRGCSFDLRLIEAKRVAEGKDLRPDLEPRGGAELGGPQQRSRGVDPADWSGPFSWLLNWGARQHCVCVGTNLRRARSRDLSAPTRSPSKYEFVPSGPRTATLATRSCLACRSCSASLGRDPRDAWRTCQLVTIRPCIPKTHALRNPSRVQRLLQKMQSRRTSVSRMMPLPLPSAMSVERLWAPPRASRLTSTTLTTERTFRSKRSTTADSRAVSWAGAATGGVASSIERACAVRGATIAPSTAAASARRDSRCGIGRDSALCKLPRGQRLIGTATIFWWW